MSLTQRGKDVRKLAMQIISKIQSRFMKACY